MKEYLLPLVMSIASICGCVNSKAVEINSPEPITITSEVRDYRVDIARCLGEKGVMVYSSSKKYCVQCMVQEDWFGEEAWKIIKDNSRVSCSGVNEDSCLDVGMDEFPTWVSADGKIKVSGHTKPEELARIFDCYRK